MMNTLYLQYALVIADSGSISKAGEQLRLKRQYLSHVLKSLESEFGITIFERKARGLAVTEDGEVFLNFARQVVDTVNQMYMQYHYPSKRGDDEGVQSLQLYVLPTTYSDTVNRSIVAFQNLYTHLKINYAEIGLWDSVPRIQQDPYALSLQMTRALPEHLQEKLPPELMVVKICTFAFSALVAKQVALASGLKSVSLRDLIDKPLIVFNPKNLKESAIEHLLRPYGEPNIAMNVDNPVVFLNFLETGHYFSIGTYSIVEINKNIVALPIQEFEENPLWVVAIIQKDMFEHPLMRDFINNLLLQVGEPTI